MIVLLLQLLSMGALLDVAASLDVDVMLLVCQPEVVVCYLGSLM